MIEIYVTLSKDENLMERSDIINYPETYLHPREQVGWVKKNIRDNIKISTMSPYILQAFRYYSSNSGIKLKLILNGENKEDDFRDAFISFAIPLHQIMNIP